MPKTSAGLLMYRLQPRLEVLLVHPGGPFFARRDEGAWSLPKGEIGPSEDPLAAAVREFTEETGLAVERDGLTTLGEIRQKGGKRVVAWAFPGDCDPSAIVSNRFEIEWPPRSGQRQSFPEIDRAEFFATADARRKLISAQVPFVERLEAALGS